MRPNTLTHKKTLDKKLLHSFLLDARNHYPTLKHHTPPPSEATTPPTKGRVVSGPNSVPDDLRCPGPTKNRSPRRDMFVAHPTRAPTASGSSRPGVHPMRTPFRGAP